MVDKQQRSVHVVHLVHLDALYYVVDAGAARYVVCGLFAVVSLRVIRRGVAVRAVHGPLVKVAAVRPLAVCKPGILDIRPEVDIVAQRLKAIAVAAGADHLVYAYQRIDIVVKGTVVKNIFYPDGLTVIVALGHVLAVHQIHCHGIGVVLCRRARVDDPGVASREVAVTTARCHILR